VGITAISALPLPSGRAAACQAGELQRDLRRDYRMRVEQAFEVAAGERRGVLHRPRLRGARRLVEQCSSPNTTPDSSGDLPVSGSPAGRSARGR
jgi:hypothetical protein